jgi:hypothetical protein
MSEYSIESCLDRLCEKVSFLEDENKQLKNEINAIKQKQSLDIELIKSDIIDSLNKKLKTDMILLSNKIELVCKENSNLKNDQKIFNETMILENKTVKSDIAYTKTLAQISYNKLKENEFLYYKNNKNPYDSDDNSETNNLETNNLETNNSEK